MSLDKEKWKPNHKPGFHVFCYIVYIGLFHQESHLGTPFGNTSVMVRPSSPAYINVTIIAPIAAIIFSIGVSDTNISNAKDHTFKPIGL